MRENRARVIETGLAAQCYDILCCWRYLLFEEFQLAAGCDRKSARSAMAMSQEGELARVLECGDRTWCVREGGLEMSDDLRF